MSAPITGTEHYEWLVPATRAAAHAFILGARFSICRKPERYDFAREELRAGEPRRARCRQCTRILGLENHVGMVEEHGV